VLSNECANISADLIGFPTLLRQLVSIVRGRYRHQIESIRHSFP
jgi:hypothetical protein